MAQRNFSKPSTGARLTKRTLSLVLPGFIAFSTLQADNWPQWRGPDRDGKSKETNLLKSWETTKPELLWMSDGLGEGYASVSVVDGIVYTTGNRENGQAVVAVNANEGGKKLWETIITDQVPEHGYEGSRCTPTIDGDHVYAISSDGIIACLTKDGELVWKKSFEEEWDGRVMSGWGFAESPLVDGDRLICTPGGPEAIIVALNKKTGEEIWRSKPGDLGDSGNDGAGYGSIAISQGAGVKQYVQMVGRGLIGVRAEDGKFLWNYNRVANGTANIPSPVIDGDHVFGSTGYGTGAALLHLETDGDNVKAREVYFLGSDVLQNHHGGMILVDGYIYCGTRHNNGFPICVEMKSGKVVWGGDFRGPGRGSAAVTYVDGNLIFRYQDGVVALIEATPSSYKLKGTFTPEHQEKESWAHPVVSDGKLYLREQDKLMCYSLKPEA